MEKNQKTGKIRKALHPKKHKKTDGSRKREGDDEKPVLFQLGSIASYGVSDVRIKADPQTKPASHSLSSGEVHEADEKERKSSLSFEGSRHSKEHVRLSSVSNELHGSSETPGSQVSGVTHVSVEPTLSSPSVQTMIREGSDQSQRNSSSPTLEKSSSTVSNDSLFSLTIGDNNMISFNPSVHVPVESFDTEEDKARVETDSEDNASWRNIGDCDNSNETPSSGESFSQPITKKKGTKKKKTAQEEQQQQKQKRRCSWLCCEDNEPCFSCCKWPSYDYSFLYKRLKCGSCSCGGWPKCCSSSCGWLFCCH